jgi:predicted nucleic acid-binding protein
VLVFDASTLILIAKAEMLESFLQNIDQPVAIPAEVEKECCGVKRSLDAFMIEQALRESRIRRVQVKNKKLVTKVAGDFGLGKGEAEAIALAFEEKAQLLGIDDKNGISACKLLGIAFTTAIGILVRMREREMITTDDALMKLDTLAKHGRYKRSILQDAKHRLETST